MWFARRSFWLLLILPVCLFLFGRQHLLAAGDQTLVVLDTRASLSGPLSVDMAVTPAILGPGDSFTLQLLLNNDGDSTALPTLTAQLPDGISAETRRVPNSVSVNLQNNTVAWQPLLQAGEALRLDVPLRVDVVNSGQEPVRTLNLEVAYDEVKATLGVQYWVGVPPQARIIAPTFASVGQEVPLLADVTGPGPVAQLWNLGDGRAFRAENPTVVFSAPGSYDIVLEVTNPIGVATTRARIDVRPEPVAQFAPIDRTLAVGEPVTIRSTSGGAGPLTHWWDFGAGFESGGPQMTHTFTEPGPYQVRLRVENAYGSAETVLPVEAGVAPVADMLLELPSAPGEPLIGRAFGDDTVTAFRWAMGDGAELTGETISHIYPYGGNFVVTLNADNAFGTTVVTRIVEITGEGGSNTVFLPAVWLSDDVAAGLPDAVASLNLDPLKPPGVASPHEQLLWYINKARQLYELPPLTFNYELSVSAQAHTNDMAANGFTGHTGSDGSRPSERQKWAGYTGFYGGEATAWGFRNPANAVEFWVNSPSHQVMILNRYATEVGVGFTFDPVAPNKWYWVAEFGSFTNGNVYPSYPRSVAPVAPTPTITATEVITTPTPTVETTPAPVVTPPPQPTATPSPTPSPGPPTPTPTPTRPPAVLPTAEP